MENARQGMSRGKMEKRGETGTSRDRQGQTEQGLGTDTSTDGNGLLRWPVRKRDEAEVHRIEIGISTFHIGNSKEFIRLAQYSAPVIT